MDGEMTTESFAEMLGGQDENENSDQSDSQNVDAAQENSEETGHDDADAGNGDDSGDDQGEQPEKDSADAFLELEINGEKVKVSKDEAKNGYLRQQDYTQKAQNLARERQESQQHIERQYQEVQRFSQELGNLTTIDAQLTEYQNVDWRALRESDPLSYSTHLAEFNDLKYRRGDVVQAIHQKQQSMASAQAQTFAQQTKEAEAHLSTVAGFKKEHIADMKAIGLKAGFKAEELAGVADKRMLEVLWKASQYDKAQATTKQVIKSVAALPTKANKPAATHKPLAEVAVVKTVKRAISGGGGHRDFAKALDALNKR